MNTTIIERQVEQDGKLDKHTTALVAKILADYGVDLQKTVKSMLEANTGECNQCHGNCDDCRYDR